MKTKAYKLAAELGVGEQSVLDWLRAHGYPNVRRADTIRAEVAQAARKAFERRGGGERRRHPSQSPRGARTGGAGRGGGTGEFRMSFAELLESHLPDETGGMGDLATATVPEMPALRPAPPDATDGHELRAVRAEKERDALRAELDALRRSYEAQGTRLDALRDELQEARDGNVQVNSLREDLERVRMERSTLRQTLQRTADERETLEHTCAELQDEVDDLQGALRRHEEAISERESMSDELASAMQRETAWRTRALELERAAQSGANLSGVLQGFGVGDYREQARVLGALLGQRDTAVGFIRAVRSVDSQALEKLVHRHIVRTCVHPICNQVALLSERIPLRVESESECEVCQGGEARRWFARMVRECGRSGVRQLLVVGGDAAHEELRGLSQGQPVDLRLVTDDDAVHPPRVQGRVEGCDLLVVWSEWVVPKTVSAVYAEVALSEGSPIVSVLGRRGAVVPMARAVCNRLARNHVLRAT